MMRFLPYHTESLHAINRFIFYSPYSQWDVMATTTSGAEYESINRTSNTRTTCNFQIDSIMALYSDASSQRVGTNFAIRKVNGTLDPRRNKTQSTRKSNNGANSELNGTMQLVTANAWTKSDQSQLHSAPDERSREQDRAGRTRPATSCAHSPEKGTHLIALWIWHWFCNLRRLLDMRDCVSLWVPGNSDGKGICTPGAPKSDRWWDGTKNVLTFEPGDIYDGAAGRRSDLGKKILSQQT